MKPQTLKKLRIVTIAFLAIVFSFISYAIIPFIYSLFGNSFTDLFFNKFYASHLMATLFILNSFFFINYVDQDFYIINK